VTGTATTSPPPAGPVEPLLAVDHLQMHFASRGGRGAPPVRAVDDVSFHVLPGETLGVVGESGCGKTTLSQCVVRLLRPQAGTITFAGRDITHSRERALRPVRHDMQMVFQNPLASLNPRRRVGQILAGAVAAGRRPGARPPTVPELLDQVGMGEGDARRYPGEFSGGQCQRIAIARALAVRPRLLVLDEPVSALDVSIQAQIVNLLARLRSQLGVAYVFIGHDLSVVRHVSDRIAVMYLGKIVEIAPTDELFARPVHWYTQALLAAVPVPVVSAVRLEDRPLLQGEPPSAADAPGGCGFSSRCPAVTELCRQVEPPLVAYADGRSAACHHPRHVDAAALGGATVSPASPRSAGAELPEPAPPGRLTAPPYPSGVGR